MGLKKYNRRDMQDETALDQAEALNILINWRNHNGKTLEAGVGILDSLDATITRMAKKLGFTPPERTKDNAQEDR
jgi:hypothetical protein